MALYLGRGPSYADFNGKSEANKNTMTDTN